MFDFIPGQRCISDTELQMGLGFVVRVDFRTVTVRFPACEEVRTYARQNAPLTRVIFNVGDQVTSHEGLSLCVASIHEQQGLLVYSGADEQGQLLAFKEQQLDDQIQLNRPLDRLLNAQVDENKWFELRMLTRQLKQHHINSELYGLIGCRTSLLPHQLFIAHEVSQRHAPRVLLADEVGLGKTIEAGLILHRQLLSDRAKRVLILLPETLMHQWLVEMKRRFNLNFSIFDEGRCLALAEEDASLNPFHSEQLIMCNLEFLLAYPSRAQQAVQGQWDTLVVDEAHHLAWTPSQASKAYQVVAQLAGSSPGLLLLTATPEQLGQAGHFARLRLLDPGRFPDLDAFLAEQKEYAPVAQVAEALLSEKQLEASACQVIRDTLEEGDNLTWLEKLQKNEAGSKENQQARQKLFSHLLDRHGTGRVLFRNTRDTVKGFPQRTVRFYPLPLPAAYQAAFALPASPELTAQSLISPEIYYRQQGGQDWVLHDPRIDWLVERLQAWQPDKVLLITASAQSAVELAQAIKQRGKYVALFHEGMRVVDRDRAAAFFADCEEGCQLLICSEIGSEGRNFQFAHRLVLFDVPFNPDLLEQRIGRIDRIGQTSTIQLHVPYIEGTPQQKMVRWYHQGLGALESTCPAAHGVFVQLRSALLAALPAPTAVMNVLVEKTKQLHQQIKQELQQGRDRLLEYNSCRPVQAQQLRQQALAEDQEQERAAYMERIFDCFGVESELDREDCYIIKPTEHIFQAYPGLPEDGMTVTYRREVALANEDVDYLSWEHPLLTTGMDLVLDSEFGNTALIASQYSALPAASLLLECLFILEIAPIEALQCTRYLPASLIRLVIDEQGQDHSEALSAEVLADTYTRIDLEMAGQVIQLKSDALKSTLQQAEQQAKKQVPALLMAAHQRAKNTLETEIHRLNALAKINRTVRQEEIDYFRQHLDALEQAIDSAGLRLDALRVIVVV